MVVIRPRASLAMLTNNVIRPRASLAMLTKNNHKKIVIEVVFVCPQLANTSALLTNNKHKKNCHQSQLCLIVIKVSCVCLSPTR